MTDTSAARSTDSLLPQDLAGGPDPVRSQREFRLLRWGLLATLGLSCAVAFALNLVDPDLWGHVKYGQEVLAEGRLPDTATHTYTADGYRWINHENLSELAFALVYEHFGVPGLTIGKCLLGIWILGLMLLVARWRGTERPAERLDSIAMGAFLFLVTLNLATYFPVRPQLFSFTLCALVLLVLDRAFCRWPEELRPRFGWLWCLPPLMVVWVNFHGAFVAGLCIVLAYLGGRGAELLWHARLTRSQRRRAVSTQAEDAQSEEARRKGFQPVREPRGIGFQPVREIEAAPEDSRASLGERCPHVWKTLGQLALVGLACAAAAVVNPYGIRLPLWLAESLRQPRPEVTEWAMLQVTDPVFVPFLLLCGLAVASMSLSRPRDWTQMLIFAAVGWQAVAHVRHVAFVALLCGFWLPGPLGAVVTRIRAARTADLPEIVLAPWVRRTLVGVLTVVLCMQAYNLVARVRELPVYRNMYPVDAVEFMASHGLEGRLVVAFNWAQYALAALSPEVQLQFDGRYDTCYPPRAIDHHFDFLLGRHEGRRFRHPESGPIDGTAVLADGGPDLVLVDRGYPKMVANMELELVRKPDKWVLLYQDGLAQLYGRRDKYDDSQSPHYVLPDDRQITSTTPKDAVPWPALPARGLSRFAYR